MTDILELLVAKRLFEVTFGPARDENPEREGVLLYCICKDGQNAFLVPTIRALVQTIDDQDARTSYPPGRTFPPFLRKTS